MKEQYYDPQTNKYPYTEYTCQHYLEVKKNNGLVFDNNYPYDDKSKKFRFLRKLFRVIIFIVVFPIMRIRLGLRIEGKDKLRKNKEIIKKGVVSISNHVHMWDYLAFMRTIFPVNPRSLSWATNIRGENGFLIRMVGGIPIPDGDIRGSMAYIKTVKELINNGNWLHIYAEGSMWEYYKPIRPFKKGAAYFAVKCNKPIIPIAYSYRKPGWIRRKIFHQIALFTAHVGDPIFPNQELNQEEAELELTRRAHEAVCRLAGIDPKENIYPPIYDDTKRIDYYTDTYGVGYKGSW